jgi:hypothetical protein
MRKFFAALAVATLALSAVGAMGCKSTKAGCGCGG